MSRTYGASVALTAAAGALRFSTLDTQSFWLDELVTTWLLSQDFTSMIHAIPSSERTPYLYYVLAWAWTHVMGDSEVGLRSLSALAGTLTVPVAYAACASLVSRRAGLLAAALVACNPFLVWYSQEGRAYSLLVLMSALSFLFFARALEGRPRVLLWWAVASSLAIATHYFAIFLVAAEAIWLLSMSRQRRSTVLRAIAVPMAVVLAHAPLALGQGHEGAGLGTSRLATRIAGLVKDLVIGYSFPRELAGTVVAAALVAVALVLLATEARAPERHGAVAALFVAMTAILLPVGIALVGPDYVIARNAIVAVVPGTVALAAGYASSRAGLIAGCTLCALSLGIAVSVATEPVFGRTDWRGAAGRLQGPARRAVVLTPPMTPGLWRPYLAGLQELDEPTAVQEIVVVALATEGGFTSGAVVPPRPTQTDPPPGFRVAEVDRRPTFTIVRYTAPVPTRVSPAVLELLRLTDAPGRVLLLNGG